MFTPNQQRVVQGTGNKNSSICIIGDASGSVENTTMRPFTGPAGSVLDSCLHAAGIVRSDCYMTNLIKVMPKNMDDFFNPRTGSFTDTGHDWIDILVEELNDIHANCIVTLGAAAMAALTGRRAITKLRGYVMESLPKFHNRKVIPSYHPNVTIRGQYILRYYITADLKKAKLESLYPEIRRPKRSIIIPITISECREWVTVLLQSPSYACDIECMNFEVSAICFAPSACVSVSFGFSHNHWTESEEFELWSMMVSLLTNRAKKIFQNGIFDICFLMTQCGIHIPMDTVEDTMIAHSVMYPEMLKGLGFLGSMYCGSQEYWKDMVKFDNIKEES